MNTVSGVFLDDYNSDLNFVIEPDGVSGSSMHKNGFEYIWAGARATHGVSTGKVLKCKHEITKTTDIYDLYKIINMKSSFWIVPTKFTACLLFYHMGCTLGVR